MNQSIIIDSIKNIIQKVFGFELNEISIQGAIVFLAMLFLLLIGKAFLSNIQNFLNNFSKKKSNFILTAIFFFGILFFFFFSLPISLLLWILLSLALFGTWKLSGGRYARSIFVFAWCVSAILPPTLEAVYKHKRYLQNQQIEVYFLLPVNSSIYGTEERIKIRKNLYDVFLSVFSAKDFDLSDLIIVYPKFYNTARRTRRPLIL